MTPFQKIVQTIHTHALIAPNNAQGQKVQNILSPHFEDLVSGAIRNHMISSVQNAEKIIAQELIDLRVSLAPAAQIQLDVSAARINEILHFIYK